MVSSKAPPVKEWDDSDYGLKLRVFCRKRRLPSNYIHISGTNIERMFAPNPDPEVPQHGLMATRYKTYVEENTAFGPDEEDFYYPTDPELEIDDRPVGKSLAKIKKEAFNQCLAITVEDDAFLHAVCKNALAHRLRWPNIKLADYIVKDALGIDAAHPHYERCKYSATKNRDTWQNRTLDAAFDIAARIYTSEWGKENLQKQFLG